MDEMKTVKVSNTFWTFRVILYLLAIVLIGFRLVDGVRELGLWRGLIRTIIIDCMVWIIVLGWFGFIPGIPRLTIKKFRNH